MSRESEKALKAMHQFLEENGAEDMSMDEVNGLLQKFTEDYNSNLPGRITEKTAKTADDYLVRYIIISYTFFGYSAII